MYLIKLFFLGAAGYLLSGLYDLALLYKRPLLARCLYPGFFVTAIPFVLFFCSFQSPHTPVIQAFTLACMALFLALTVYSVLLELPLRGEGGLYTKGTYALCRHPGVLWYSIFSLLTASYFWYAPLVWVCLGYIGCNIALVVFEDTYVFPRLFPQYTDYKNQTPFLIPFWGWRERRSLR